MDAKCEVCGVVAEIADVELIGGRVEFQCVGCDTPHWATRSASGRLPRKAVPVKRARASRPPVAEAPVPDSTRLDDLRSLMQRSAVSASSLPPPRLGAPPALLTLDDPRSAVAADGFDEVAPPSVREAIRSSAPPLSDPDLSPQSDAITQNFVRDVDAAGAPSSRRFGTGRSARAGVAAVACAVMLFGTGSALSARLGPDRGVAVTGAGASVSAAAHGATYGAFDVDVVTGAARPVAELVSAQARAAAATSDGSASVLAAASSARTAPAGAGRAVGAAAASPAGQAIAAAPETTALNKQSPSAKKQRVVTTADAGPKTLAEAMAQAARTSKK